MKHFNPITWASNSWQTKNRNYIPVYDLSQVQEILDELKERPGIVSIQQVKNLSDELIKVNLRKSFLVQVGDCAESFSEKDYGVVSQKVDLMMAIAKLIPERFKPLIVGRIAGQYAKPRTHPFETINSVTLPAYQGDLINSFAFTPESRKPNPILMYRAYDAAREVFHNINTALSGNYHDSQKLYISHEALHLYYEEGLTRSEEDLEGKSYNLSTHFPWLGMRTATSSEAHIEYLRGIHNPIAIKLGPFIAIDKIVELIETLNPNNEPGRITLIHRLGETKIADILPQWINTLKNLEKNIIWCCDPMHGNNEITFSGIKTRRLAKIMNELQQAFDIHKALDSFLGGVHLEVTPHNVTECIDNISSFESNLTQNYQTLVDPRLNPSQALQVMDLVNKKLNEF